MAQIAIRGRDATSTKVLLFFLQHGYNVDPIQLETNTTTTQSTGRNKTEAEKADDIVKKLREIFEFAQAAMASAQQANRRRREPSQLRISDKVWLKLDEQLSTGRPSGKFHIRYA